MISTPEELKARKPEHDFLICIDSDGCAFDTMELKHKECFIPNIIKHWGLQAVSKYAREAAEFVNLYSKHRGVNRFPALILTFDLLLAWDKVAARNVAIPEAANLRRWIKEETKLGNPVLAQYCASHPDEADMQRALLWSKAINHTVEEIVGGGVPPFPLVKESLVKAAPHADMMVCSQTPTAALTQEWTEQGIAQHVFAIAGQEWGTKSEHIKLASEGRYPAERILMIGDAPGDRKAANANNACFFPINPGDEDASWQRFHEEGLELFLSGNFLGEYQEKLNAEFDRYLPENPPWKSV